MATLAQNIRRAIDDFNTIEDAIVRKGVPVPDGTPTSEYGEKILSIETGVDTSGDTVVPSALREGYTAHNATGQEITGTIPDYSGGNTVEMTSPDGATLNTAGTYCEGNIEVVPKLQSKTATTGEIVTADDGYVGLESVDTNPAFEAGKKSEYDAFWDGFQQNEKKSLSGRYAGRGWTKNNFRPKHDIKCSGNLLYTFYCCGAEVDLVEVANSLGIEISFNGITGGEYIFYHADFTRLPELDFSLATNKSLWGIFTWMDKLHTIDKLILPADGSLSFMNSFNECKVLVNLTIEGAIGKNGFDFHWSPLSKASITSIINALSDTTTGLTVTVRLSAVKTAFETSEGAADGSTSEEWTALIATKPNWTINLINS